ncbi:MAG: hypothetical protein IT455_14090 [Planctomycetes bacterium]|nr:hypothetical protein [Planctomycetota bacterium]
MSNTTRIASILASALFASLAAAQITPGNLIVSRTGDGALGLTSAAQARFLDEYTPAGVFVQTIALPTAPSGTNRMVTDSGTATSNGFITQSVDGRYLIAVGYDAAPGTAGVTGTAAATTARVICRVGLDGSVDSSTALGDAYTTNNFRCAASLDGNQFWTAGTGTAPTNGARYVANLGDTTSTQLSTTVTNLRCINIQNGQLYCSSQSGAFLGVSAVGTGLPTTGGETITAVESTTSSSAYDFWFADANTLYVADDRTNGSGGIMKFTYDAGTMTWPLAYTLTVGASTGCRGLSGYVDNGVVTLFATANTSSTTSGSIVTGVDNGAGSTFTTIATSPTNTVFRDVQFVRTPANVTHSGTGCATSFGTPAIGTSGGVPVTGNLNFAITTSNNAPFSFALFMLAGGPALPVGVNIPGSPACALIYVIPTVLPGGLTDGLGELSSPMPIPANASLGGADLSAQIVVFDLSLVGFGLPIGTSDALTFVVGN